MKKESKCENCIWYWYDEEHERNMCHIPTDENIKGDCENG